MILRKETHENVKNKEYRVILETQYEVVNYKGVLIMKNPMTPSWFVFFEDQSNKPIFGKFSEVKREIDKYETTGMLSMLQKY
jgi:hypothetical protein